MAVTTTALFETAAAPAVETTVYTSTATTLIDKLTSYGTAAGDLTLKLVPSGGTAASANILAKKTFAVGESYTWPELVGHTLMPGDFISAIASTTSAINLRISGRRIT